MKKSFLALSLLTALAVGVIVADETVNKSGTGLHIGTSAADRVGFHGTTPAAQRSGANQTALTDSTGGSVSNATLADGLTVTAPAAITAYTAHASGSTPVTSNAATDLDTTAAPLATAVSELTALRAKVNTIVTDVGTQNDNQAKIAELVNELRAALVEKGLITGS